MDTYVYMTSYNHSPRGPISQFIMVQIPMVMTWLYRYNPLYHVIPQFHTREVNIEIIWVADKTISLNGHDQSGWSPGPRQL